MHAQIADRIIGNIVQASGPAVSPDGTNVAFVVSRVDMTKNQNFSQVWLAVADGSTPRERSQSASTTAARRGARRTRTSPSRRRGRQEERDHPPLLPIASPGETTHDRDDERRRGPTSSGALTAVGWPSTQPYPDERYAAEDRVGSAAARSSGLHQARQRGLGLRSTEARLPVSADGTGAPRNLTPGEFEHGSIAWRPTPRPGRDLPRANKPGTSTFAISLYTVSLEGEVDPSQR